MEHQHITPKNPKWDRHKYICECGFETDDRIAFDRHLQKYNKPVEQTAEKTPQFT